MNTKPAAAGKPAVASEALLNALFLPFGVAGVYGRSGAYEAMVDALSAFISRQRDPRAEVVRFPPVVSRSLIEKSGYLKSFPHLLGCVCALQGDERQIGDAVERILAGGDWTNSVTASELVLAPAACYPVYPLAAKRGVVPKGGLLFDVASDCFRREPSHDIDRLQSFRMREYVAIGSPDDIVAFRAAWMERAGKMADTLALPWHIEAASDPFFGRGGKLVGRTQIEEELKFELVVPVRLDEKPTACMSFNYHRDHFGQTWNMRALDGQPAHTSCIAFGMDRIAVAMFANHGLETSLWPPRVKSALGV